MHSARSAQRVALVVLTYVALYLALHWLSLKFQTGPVKISPFSPAHGLSLALLLLFGLRYAPALVLGPLIICLSNRRASDPAWFLLVLPLTTAVGYGLAAVVLKRVLRVDPYLRRLRDVNWFALVSVLASGMVACLASLELVWAERIVRSDYGRYVTIWWVGDAVGIATLAPFLLITVAPWAKEIFGHAPSKEIAHGRSSVRRNWSKLELAAQAASVVLVLWIVFGWHIAAASHLYYICFLPLTWIVLRHDRQGASLAVLATNFGVLLAVRGLQLEFVELANVLLFLEVLSISGLVLGAVVHERRQAEQALRRGEERYRAYLQQRSEGIARFENERPVLIDLPEEEQIQLLLRHSYLAECNNVQARMYGFAGAEEMIGFRLTDSIDRSKPANIENLRAFIRSGYRLADVESQEFDRHGNTRYFLNSAIGIVENGALVRFWGTQLDITDHKRAEEAQRASEERFSRAFNASPLPMTISTVQEGRLIDVNAAYLRASGFTRDDVIGRTSADLNIWPAPEDRSRFIDLFKANGAISNVEVAFRSRKGKLRTTLLSADVIDLDGERCVLIVANDITQRKRAEDALRKSEMRLANAQQLAHIGNWESDLKTGQLYWSDETYRILGLDPRSTTATDETYWNAVHPEDKTALGRLISETLLKGRVYSVDHRIVLPDGSVRVVHAQGEAIVDKDGLVVRLVGTAQDITERKQMEEALIASEARFRHVFESNMLGIGYSGAGGIITDANDILLRILGSTRADVLARLVNWREITPLEYEDLDNRAIADLASTGAFSPYEKECVRRDGERVPILIGGALLGGFSDQAVFFVLDITERKRAEQVLRQSEQLHRTLFERNLAGVYRSTLDGWIVECNDSLARILGYESAEEIRSRPAADLYYDPADRGRFIEKLSEHGALTDLEWCMRRRDGSPVWVIENTMILDAGGDVCIQGTLVDITARKRAEEALRESEAIFRTLADTITAGIFIYRGERFIYANPAAQTITGYSLEDLLSMNMFDTVHPDHRQMVRGFVQARQEGRPAPSQYELKIVTKTGEQKWADMTASAINHQGQPAVMITAFDLTYRKQAEEALRESERRLRAVLEHLPVMVADLDENSAPVFWNRECERVTGYGPEEMLGNTKALKLLLPDQQYRKDVLAEHARRAGEYRDMETQIVCKDGSIRTLAWSNFAGRVEIAGWTNWGVGFDVTTRKQAEEGLRKAEEKYRSIFENAVEGIYQSSPSGQFITANPALARILGYQSPADLMQNLTDLHNGQYVEPGRRVQFRRLLEEQPSVVGFENQSYRKDGGKIWISENGRAVRDSNGTLLYYEGTMEDVTNRKRAEQRQVTQFAVTRVLAESATLEDAIPELLKSICTEFEWETGVFWLVDTELEVLRLETAWQIASGGKALQESCRRATLSLGECLAGRVWSSRTPVWNPDAPGDSDHPAGARAVRGSFGFPIPVGGEVFGVMEFLNSEVRERDDDLLKMVADIGSRIGQFIERKRAEDEQTRLQSAIRSAAIEWQLTFDAIESPVLVLDLDGRVRRLNRAAQLLSGKADSDCVGSEVGQLHSGEPWQRITESVGVVRVNRSAASGQVVDQSNGRSWEIVASPFLAPGERDEWVIAVARDVSGMAELQESLRRSETMSAMGSLVAGVAHEVRNPLFGISATLDAFDARFGAREEFQQYTKVLRGELDRLSRLMQDLLDYGKPASLNLSEGRMEAVVAEALQICGSMAERSQVCLVSDLNCDLRPVRMDQRRLVQVFQNLLENAVHHSPAASIVTVDAEEVTIDQRVWIECSIKDSGKGFLVEDLPRLFEPFFTRRRGGTGLGLSIVQRIVEQHGGHVGAANRPEGGAIILLRFPAE